MRKSAVCSYQTSFISGIIACLSLLNKKYTLTMIYIQGNSNSRAIIRILEIIKDMKSVKQRQSHVTNNMPFKSFEIPSTSRDIQKNRKLQKSF